MSDSVVVEDEVHGVVDNKERSLSPNRSRSPVNIRNRLKIYEHEGTNTISDQPHLMRARLFVGNAQKMQRSDLRRLFSRYGEVLGVSIHKGYAFVQLDRERNANRAINYEDNSLHLGCKIHVEFSQAAKKAGAKFERMPIERERSRSPVRVREKDRVLVDKLEEREARLARILQMEKELSYISSMDDHRRAPPSDYQYEKRDTSYHRESPQPRGYESSYRSRDYDRREPRDRGYYDRPSSPRPSPPKTGSVGGYRDSVSYPMQKRQPAGYDSRESSRYGGGNSGGGYSGSGSISVGYGGNSGGRPGKPSGSNGAPPGWPSSGFGKPNPNQRPFSNSGPWN